MSLSLVLLNSSELQLSIVLQYCITVVYCNAVQLSSVVQCSKARSIYLSVASRPAGLSLDGGRTLLPNSRFGQTFQSSNIIKNPAYGRQ